MSIVSKMRGSSGRPERFLQCGDAFLRVRDKRLGLPEFLLAFTSSRAQSAQGFDLIAQSTRAFEVQIFGRFDHVALEPLQHLGFVAIEKTDQSAYIFAVSFLADLGRTRRGALLLIG